jgi:uncharacterized protein DUF1566
MKTINFILVILFISVISCTKENAKLNSVSAASVNNAAQQTFHIGDSYGGGIIFYLDSTKKHGLIAAKTDQSTGISWYKNAYIKTNALATAIGKGALNTQKIVNAQGSNGSYAAKLCANYVSGGFTDWFLPSKSELNQLYLHKSKVPGLAATNYWSSSEYDTNTAYDQEFGGGYKFNDDKSFTIHVRAVRAF